ncbi:transcriptional regulator family: HMG [Aspergillus niger]|nr:transcriptional regulator family: HMG [Aspergillus niger]
MSEASAATTKPTGIGTEASVFLQATPGDPMSEPPPPYFQSWFMPGTGCEDLIQHLPCISDGLPQGSGKHAVSFDQPIHVPEIAVNNLYHLVPQPICGGTQVHANSLIPAKGTEADQMESKSVCRNHRLRLSNRAVATTRNNQVDHAVISSQDLDLPCPLSALTEGMQHIPVRDMYAWVDRPVETRRQEALQRHKRIPRPLNSFILYRLAYSDRVKYWLGRNDPQTISRLSGQSWKMEAPDIRKQYETLAEKEKWNHARAHPGYRFSPSSKRGQPRTAKGRSQELALRSKAFSKLGHNPQPTAWSPSMDNDRASERSTEASHAEEGTLIHSDSLNPDGFIPLGSAASVWEHWTSYSQTTSAEPDSKGTQPCLPVATGKTEIPATACFVPQPAAPGIDAANSTFAGILLPITEAMSESVYGSSCDESDFLTLFNEPTPLENPPPSVSWVEAEMAKMEAKDQHDSQHCEFVSDDLSLRDRQMIGPSLDYVSCLSQGTRAWHSDRVS